MTIELTFIPALIVILIAAALGRLLSKLIRQPAIFGELLLGIIIGSFVVLTTAEVVPGQISAQEPISAIADIGIILLLFSTGLGINFEEFKRLEVASSVVAVLGVILPFVLGYFTATFFGFSRLIALFVGVALVATSVGVGASILTELRMLRTKMGTLIMGAAVMDDIIGVLMMSLVGIAVVGVATVTDIFLLVVSTVLFFLLSLTAGIKLFRKFSEIIHLGRENLLMLGLIVVLLFGLITEEIGLATIIGAFVAGLIVGQTHFAGRLGEQVSLVGGSFFIPIFFVTMGMKFEVEALTAVSSFAIVLVVVAIIGKVVGCGLGARAFKFSGGESFAVGVAMMPRAGVELILIKLGLDWGLIGPGTEGAGIESAILIMVIITTLIAPPALWKALKRVRIQNKIGAGKYDRTQERGS